MQKIQLIIERRKEIPKAKQYMKKSSISSVIREMQIKMTAIHYLIKKPKIK